MPDGVDADPPNDPLPWSAKADHPRLSRGSNSTRRGSSAFAEDGGWRCVVDDRWHDTGWLVSYGIEMAAHDRSLMQMTRV